MNLFESVNNGVNIFTDIISGKKNNNNLPSNKRKNNDNDNNNEMVYDSYRLDNGIKKLKERTKIRHEKARDPIKTGIISRVMKHPGSNKKSIINKENFDNVPDDSEFSEDPDFQMPESISTLEKDPRLIINESQKLLDNRFHERQFTESKNVKDSFLNQYEPLRYDMKGAPSSANAVNRSESAISRLQTERKLAMKEGYSNFGQEEDNTYGVVSKEKFLHNNMIPNFKSKSYGPDVLANKSRNDTFQRAMQTYTGNDIKIAKTEQKPLFSPLTGITNIFGTPSVTPFLEDRYIPGKERKNELPFRQQRVTSGLNIGYNEVNKNGDNFRVLPKTIDEMRTADKVQKSYTFSQVKGMAGQNRGPVIGNVKKYRPERTAYWGDFRLVPSLGYIRAPALYGEVNPGNMATANRGTTDQPLYHGPANSEVQQAMPDTLREKFKVDFKQNYKQAEPRNVMLVEGLQARENTNSYNPTITQRSKKQEYMGPIGNSQVSKGHAFDMITNIFDITKRNISENTDRYGVVTGDRQKTNAIDFNEVARNTIRQTTEKTERYGNVGSDRINGIAIDFNETARPTNRQITENTDRYGQFGGDGQKGIAIDFNETARPTIRQTTENADRYGQFGGDGQKGISIDFNETARPTIRQTTENADRYGQFGGDGQKGISIDFNETARPTNRQITENAERYGQFSGDGQKGISIDFNETARPTNRQITENTDRYGIITGDRQQSHAIDFNETARPTIRQTTENTDRYGIITGDRQKLQAVDFNETARPTIRQFTENTDRAGVITGDKQQTLAIDFNETARPTMRQITERTDRAGHINGDRNPGYTINYSLMTPNVTNREMHSKLDRTNGGITGNYQASRTREDINNTYVNIEKEKIAKGRAPTNSKYNKGPTLDFSTVTLVEPIQIKRDLLGSTIAIHDKLPFILTRTPTGRTIRNTRMNEFTEQNLDSNPYINNIVHKSVST